MTFDGENFGLSATDLSNHVSCRHLTELNRRAAKGELKRPYWKDPSLEVLEQRGRDHEAAYVAYLESLGKRVVRGLKDAMKEGADIIVQASLDGKPWGGIADILIKVDKPSALGSWSYEVQDTKLAQNTKAGTILQLSLYSELLATLQGKEPEFFHVVKPGDPFTIESYRFDDFKAYYRTAKSNLETVVQGPPTSTYPEPTEHCSICRWWKHCDQKRHDDDYVSLVAGIRASQIEELKSQGINQLTSFANATSFTTVKRGNRESLLRKQKQAQVQLEGKQKDQLIYWELAVQPASGLNRLPEPSKGDIYFDIEGDAYFPDGGLEYILGVAFLEEGKLTYRNDWSTNRSEEKKAFVRFMEFVMDRWKRFPNMYIYHFAPYEPSAVKRLARVHASFEKEVDDLLRAERFIDLHAVFKEGLLASVETYSLKALELFTDYRRQVELQDASIARKAVEVALELGEFRSLAKETIRTTEVYNEDDCRATHALHIWLEDLRTRLVAAGTPITRPEIKTGEASEEVQQQDTRSLAIFQSLIKKIPEDRAQWTAEHHAQWLLAHQIDYFRREDKSAWWEFFRVHELDEDELLDERKALTGLKFIGEQPKVGRDRNPTHRYSFPPQEHSVEEGDEVYEVKGEKIGTVKAISDENQTIDIKKSGSAINIHPRSVHVSDRIGPGALATSLVDLAADVDDNGLSHAGPCHAAKDILMKRLPVLQGGKVGAVLEHGEDVVAGSIRIALALNRSYLAIQGPPGSGKTYTGAKMIIELAKQGLKIGITAISHKVIRNLIDRTVALSKTEGVKLKFAHKVNEKSDPAPADVLELTDSGKALAALDEGAIVGGTAWLWADAKAQERLDYLFIDEAGQMSLSHALAAARAAKNLILLGDPQQLEQPQKGAHPEGSDVAALAYILEGHAVMPEGKGLFLGITRRLHPKIAAFTSEVYYENKLSALAGLENQRLGNVGRFDGAGLFLVPIEHRGNSNKSIEEIETVADIVASLLGGGTFTNSKGETRPLHEEDIVIVAPYNAQVSALSERLPSLRVGTVDKFQGQEAPVVIYSMTSSSHEDAPRGMSFLYSPNRLNVATSRAMAACILVASPRLLEPECHTIDQMRWANGLCRYVEMAINDKFQSAGPATG